MPEHAHHHHTANHPHTHGSSDDHLADLLDLDAVVLHDYWAQVMAIVSDAVPRPPRRVVDLGAGTGVGALALAELFPHAEVVAVDVSPESLQRLERTAAARHLRPRVRTLVTDLDTARPEVAGVDLAWSSLALHHLADPVRVLADLREVTNPDGVLVVAEFEDALRFLPDDLGVGRPGFEERLADRLAAEHRELLPLMDTAWPGRLAAAGWTVTATHTLTIDLDPPDEPEANRYAWGWFSRLAEQFGERLEDDDRVTLSALVAPDGPHSLLHRTDLHLRGERMVTVARR